MPILNVFLIIGVICLIISLFVESRSAVWGGATLGLIIGVVVGFIKSDFSDTLRYALISADLGLLANVLSWIGNRLQR